MEHQSLSSSLAFSYKTMISLLLLSHIASCATLPKTNSSRLFQTRNECTSNSDWLGHSPPSEVSALGHLLLLSDKDISLKANANRVALDRKTAMLL